MRTLETDYFVVGAGAAGMAFTDELIANSSADVVMVDRRYRPGRPRRGSRAGCGGRILGPGGQLFHPSPRLATDNAAMIARAAVFHYSRGERAGLDLNAHADLPFPGLVPSAAR